MSTTFFRKFRAPLFGFSGKHCPEFFKIVRDFRVHNIIFGPYDVLKNYFTKLKKIKLFRK